MLRSMTDDAAMNPQLIALLGLTIAVGMATIVTLFIAHSE
jgi:hypothetical protein